MRRAPLAFLLLALACAPAAADVPTPMVAFGQPETTMCQSVVTTVWVAIDLATRTGHFAVMGPSCEHATSYGPDNCDDLLICWGECAALADGSAACWYGGDVPDPSLAITMMTLAPDGWFRYFSHGSVYVDGQLSRIA